MRIIVAFVLGVALTASASAQSTTNLVLEHFRAYRAALAAGDLATAETAAAAALAASEARDGDGGRTAVLALNLAGLRLARGQRAQALAPAQRAHTIASANAQSGIDPLMARLILARATLAGDAASKDLFATTLVEAAQRNDLAADIYLAAIDLGRQEMMDQRFEEAARAWSVAAAHSASAPGDTTLANAQALTLEAVAHIYSVVRYVPAPRVRPAETAAHDKLHQAMQLTVTAFHEARDAGAISARARAYATALAWHLALDARLGRQYTPWRHENLSEAGIAWSGNDREGECALRIYSQPRPSYPLAAQNRLAIGSVIVWMQLDAAGAVASREILASAPEESDFVDAINEVLPHWRVERGEDAAADCTMPRTIVRPVTFRIGS